MTKAEYDALLAHFRQQWAQTLAFFAALGVCPPSDRSDDPDDGERLAIRLSDGPGG